MTFKAVIGGTIVKLVRKGLSVLSVDLCEVEPARHAARGERHAQAMKAAEILGVERTTLTLQDRLITDTVEARLQVARLLREHRPSMVFTTPGAGVHPAHKAVTDIVSHGVFYARLPKWNEVAGGEQLQGTELTRSIVSSTDIAAWSHPGIDSISPWTSLMCTN